MQSFLSLRRKQEPRVAWIWGSSAAQVGGILKGLWWLWGVAVVKKVSSWPGQECSHPLEASHRDFTPGGNSIPQVESSVNHLWAVAGEACHSDPTYRCTNANGVSWRNTPSVAFDFLSSEMYCILHTAYSLSVSACMGWVRSCSILLRWEQTQLTASFLTVNIAAPLRYGSGTRTPLHLPPTALPTKEFLWHITHLPPPSPLQV